MVESWVGAAAVGAAAAGAGSIAASATAAAAAAAATALGSVWADCDDDFDEVRGSAWPDDVVESDEEDEVPFWSLELVALAADDPGGGAAGVEGDAAGGGEDDGLDEAAGLPAVELEFAGAGAGVGAAALAGGGALGCCAGAALAWLGAGVFMLVCRRSEKLCDDELAGAELGAGGELGPDIISRIAGVMNRAACA
jgi:hypothetical protein